MLDKGVQEAITADKDFGAAAAMAVVPVKHTIRIEPIK
jgi:hypothetical protein